MGVCRYQRGRMFVVEVKSTYGKLDPKQKQWIYELQTRGVICIVARSVDDVIDRLQAEDKAPDPGPI